MMHLFLTSHWAFVAAALSLAFCLSTAQAEETMMWSNQGPYQRVGFKQDLDMPAAVVKFTQGKLHEMRTKWYVYGIFHSEQRQQYVVVLDTDTRNVTFLVTPQSWCLLTKQSLSCINQVMGRDLSERSLRNEKKLNAYLYTLDSMVLGQGVILDNVFVREEITSKGGQENIGWWLLGREKRLEALRQLCHRPIVTVQGNQITIIYNRMTYPGAVLRRTVHAKMTKWLEITGLEEVEIRSKGTFYDPILG